MLMSTLADSQTLDERNYMVVFTSRKRPGFIGLLKRPFGASSSNYGMSLIEIIIVVALLGTLMAYLVRNLMGTADNAKIDQTKLAMGVLQQGLQMYKVHNNKYPTTDQGLDALLTQPGDSKTWRGPYTESNKTQDPWGNKFNYESDGRTFKIISSGIDQQFGTADDISYPEESEAASTQP